MAFAQLSDPCCCTPTKIASLGWTGVQPLPVKIGATRATSESYNINSSFTLAHVCSSDKLEMGKKKKNLFFLEYHVIKSH